MKTATLALVFLVALTGAASADRAVDVVNLTRTAIIGLQVRAAGGTVWGLDALANTRRTLGIQKIATISVPGSACAYDFRLMFEDGHSAIKRNIDVCKNRQVKLSEY
jgi:hypothetical protein